jgi:hypothetical protein
MENEDGGAFHTGDSGIIPIPSWKWIRVAILICWCMVVVDDKLEMERLWKEGLNFVGKCL